MSTKFAEWRYTVCLACITFFVGYAGIHVLVNEIESINIGSILGTQFFTFLLLIQLFRRIKYLWDKYSHKEQTLNENGV